MNQIHLQSANGNLAAVFPSLVRLCLKQTARGDHERQLKILTRRHGLDGAPINTEGVNLFPTDRRIFLCNNLG